MTAAEVRRAGREDLDLIGRVLGAAFDDDPLLNWIVRQDEQRARAIETLFREVTRFAYIDEGESYLLADGTGAAVWRPPTVAAPADEGWWEGIVDEVVGSRGRRHSELFGELVESKHPQSPPHCYLFAIGVEPSRQGDGAGSRLIRHVLDRCDREGVPAYLENSKERNLAFYGKHGFEVRERVDLPEGGPPVWLMWRSPSPTATR